jgi:hypothetical protein
VIQVSSWRSLRCTNDTAAHFLCLFNFDVFYAMQPLAHDKAKKNEATAGRLSVTKRQQTVNRLLDRIPVPSY